MSPLSAEQTRSAAWYVVITHAHQERVAWVHLRRQGFEVYLPLVPPPAGLRKRYGVAPGPRPMIPRYLFVRVEAGECWRAILSTVGVHDVIKRGSGEHGRPASIPDRFIEELQAREVAGVVVLPPKSEDTTASSACAYKRGDRIRWSGPTADYDFIFEQMVDGDRAQVVFNLLGVDSRQVIRLPSRS